MKDKSPRVEFNPDQYKAALAHWRKNPVEAVKDWFKITPDDYQAAILNDTFNNPLGRVSAKSAHGVGKTAILSWSGWIFLNCFEQSRVVATAPVQAQLHDILWPEYAKWHLKMPEQFAALWEISGGHIRHKDHEKTWFAVSRTSNKSANLQGFHGNDILIQIDEASAVPQEVVETIEGALSEAGEDGKTAILQMTGNPNFTAGEFHAAFTKNADLYSRFTITGDPNLLDRLGIMQGGDHKREGKVFFSKRVKEKYRATMAKKYGTTGAVYDVRVRGVFPSQSDEAVVPMIWAERAQMVELPKFDAVADPITLVMDVARKGGNETVLGAFRKGHCLQYEARPSTSTAECVDMLADAMKYWNMKGCRVIRMVVDEPGVGGGVVDFGIRQGLPIVPYNGAAGFTDADPEEDIRMFSNRRSRDWWNVRRLMEAQQCAIPEDEELVNQIASLQYEYGENQKIKVESKEKYRARLGRDANCDRADMIVMGLASYQALGAAGNIIAEGDVVMGEDRERLEEEF